MNFYCFQCEKIFGNVKNIIEHLKKDHGIVDNEIPIKCCANKLCEKTYKTFKGLRSHLNQPGSCQIAVCINKSVKMKKIKYNFI